MMYLTGLKDLTATETFQSLIFTLDESRNTRNVDIFRVLSPCSSNRLGSKEFLKPHPIEMKQLRFTMRYVRINSDIIVCDTVFIIVEFQFRYLLFVSHSNGLTKCKQILPFEFKSMI